MTNEESMALCAIRYCMGRRSYIVSDGVAWARRYGAQSKHLRGVVIRDIEEAIAQMERCPDIPMLGDKMDEREWRAVLHELKMMDDGGAAPWVTRRAARGMEVRMPDGALPGCSDREASPSLPYPTPHGDRV